MRYDLGQSDADYNYHWDHYLLMEIGWDGKSVIRATVVKKKVEGWRAEVGSTIILWPKGD